MVIRGFFGLQFSSFDEKINGYPVCVYHTFIVMPGFTTDASKHKCSVWFPCGTSPSTCESYLIAWLHRGAINVGIHACACAFLGCTVDHTTPTLVRAFIMHGESVWSGCLPCDLHFSFVAIESSVMRPMTEYFLQVCIEPIFCLFQPVL